MEKCQEAWSCRVESCEDTMFKANQAAKQCYDNRVNKCRNYHFGNGCLNIFKCLGKDALTYSSAALQCMGDMVPLYPVDCKGKRLDNIIRLFLSFLSKRMILLFTTL